MISHWRWTHLDTTSSFMIGRCRTCQASKSTERGHERLSGPKSTTFGTIARCLAPNFETRALVVTLNASDNGVSSSANSYRIFAQLQSKFLYLLRPHFIAAQLSPTITRLVQGSRDRRVWWPLGCRLTAKITQHYDHGPSHGQARPI